MKRNTHRPDFIFTTLKPCPHPSKTKFRTRAEAKRTLRYLKSSLTTNAFGSKPKPYLCDCGAWHLGHPPHGKRLHPALR